MSIINKFFNKVYIICLEDKTKLWNDIKKKLDKKKIKAEKFIALDGRCTSDETMQQCIDKIKTFEIILNTKIKIPSQDEDDLDVLSPRLSLSIGTLKILKNMVKENYDYILILEPDVYFDKHLDEKFINGIKELGDAKWDLLYLGSGSRSGLRGISVNKTEENKYFSDLAKIENMEFYVANKDDTRKPCKKCKEYSDHLTIPYEPHGGFGIGYSLSGAKKVIKFMEKNMIDHHDVLKGDKIRTGKIKAFSFDPPILYHSSGVNREDTTIPWDW